MPDTPKRGLAVVRARDHPTRYALGHRRQSSCIPPRHLVAGIAVAALPVRRELLTEILEDVARSTLRRLTEGNDRPELRLIPRPALLVVHEVRAQVTGDEVVAHSLPAAAAMLTHQAVPLEQHHHDARL